MNKYNAEGYYDPTAYEALTAVEKEEKAAARVFRPLVYICSPQWTEEFCKLYHLIHVEYARIKSLADPNKEESP